MGFKKRTKVSAEFSMSSLTDIIFLLLIFFMLTSSLVSPTAINLKLPSSSRSTVVSTHSPIKVSVSKTKDFKLNGKRIAEDALRSSLNSTIIKDGRVPTEITVILSLHELVDAQTLVTMVDMMNDFGVKMILATKKDK